MEVRNGKGFYDKEGIFWVSKGSVLLARPDKGSGFNQTAFSDAVTENGEWVFSLEQRDRAGNLLANSEKNGFRYRIDDRPPDIKLTGETGVAGKRIFRKNCTFSAEEIRDEESGLDTVEYCILSLENKGKKQSYATYAPGSAICVDQEGTWQVRFRLRDRVGNERKLHSAAVVIDRTDPRISVRGLEEGKSYQKEERFQAVVEDKHLFSEKTVCEVKNQQGKTVLTPGQETAENKQTLSYDFSTGRLADGNYTLCVQAEDQAGNQVKKTVPFRMQPFRFCLYAFFGSRTDQKDLLHPFGRESVGDRTKQRPAFGKSDRLCKRWKLSGPSGRERLSDRDPQGWRPLDLSVSDLPEMLSGGRRLHPGFSVRGSGRKPERQQREKHLSGVLCGQNRSCKLFDRAFGGDGSRRGRVYHTGQRQRETGLYGTLEKWKKALLDDGGERRGGGKAFRRNHRFPDFCRRSGG